MHREDPHRPAALRAHLAVNPSFRSDLSGTPRPLAHVWEHTVGSGYAPLALRADWQGQMRRAHAELGFQHVRFHGILSDDMGTLITHADEPLYSFFNTDQIFDALLEMGVRPFVELSFMPWRLASGDGMVFRYKANITPPRDYADWAKLIRMLVGHWVERYGAAEVRRWPFEVWNEPNLKAFWTGTQADYFELYRHTVREIKDIDPDLMVGGPSSAQNDWIPEFLEFCERENLPADYVSTHHYPTDAFGQPGDDTLTQLAKSERGVLRERAVRARKDSNGRPLYYTEWNSSSNPRDSLHDEPYAAAFVAKTALEAAEIVDGYAFWVVSDIFAENFYPSIPFHGGFGLLNIYGIAKPTYRAFELMHGLGTAQYEVTGSHPTVDAWVVEGRDDVTVFLTNHALPRHPISAEEVRVTLAGARPPVRASITRVDARHANAKHTWAQMGSPAYLSPDHVLAIEDASRLMPEPIVWTAENGTVTVECALPPHAIAAIRLELR